MVIEKKFDAAENCWRIQLFGDIDIYNAPELKKELLGATDADICLDCAHLKYIDSTGLGVLVAALWHRSGKSATGALDSRAGFRGLCKKGTVLLVVYIGVLLDRALGIDYVRGALVLFFCGNEGLSLLENIGLMGVPYPPALRKMLEALKTEGKMTTDDQGGTH